MFGRGGAPGRRDGTKIYGVSDHVFKSVIRVVDAKYSLTPCVGSSRASVSLSECKYLWGESPEPRNGREYCVEVVDAIVLGLTRVKPNTTKQRVAHFYPLRAPVKAVDR